jgi:hypothetical protein
MSEPATETTTRSGVWGDDAPQAPAFFLPAEGIIRQWGTGEPLWDYEGLILYYQSTGPQLLRTWLKEGDRQWQAV